MNLAHPLLSAILCSLIIEAVLFAAGNGSVPAGWVPYVIMAANTAAVVILWWLIETVEELSSGVTKPTPVDGGKPVEPPGPVQPPAPPVQPPAKPPVSSGDDRFAACIPLTLGYEGGNDDDPRDPGGRTSRGILQTEWDRWRSTHPGLPADVWEAPQDQVLAIYKANYWEAMSCGSLAPGVDFAVFDFGVNSGNSRSAKFLQDLVGTDQDGEIGPDTIAAAGKLDPAKLVGDFCDARLAFLKGLGTWSTFGKGWSNRVADVRAKALAMVSAPSAPPTPISSVSGAAIIAIMTSLDGTHWTDGNNPTINAWIETIAAKWPDLASYARTFENHGYFAWCGLTAGYVMTRAGFKPPASFFLAADWLNFGTKVNTPQPGDVLVYQWGDGSHHVSLYDHETDGNYYSSHGGNQSHTVNITQFPMASCIGIRRPT